MPAELPRHIALAGPTASGKTAASMAIAQRFPVEIISVDSALSTAAWTLAPPNPAPLNWPPCHTT